MRTIINRVKNLFISHRIIEDDVGCVTFVERKFLWFKKIVYKDHKHLKLKNGGFLNQKKQ